MQVMKWGVVLVCLGGLNQSLAADFTRSRESALSEVHHYFYGAISGGGDELVKPDSGRSMRAGSLFHLSYGARWGNVKADNWLVDVRAGIKLDVAEGSDAMFIRYPFELEVQRRLNDSFGIGAGATYHYAPVYTFKADGFDDKVEFDSPLGYFLTAEYYLTNDVSLGGRYSVITYEKDGASFVLPGDDETVKKINGDSLEFYISYRF